MLTDRLRIRLRLQHPSHVRAYNFVADGPRDIRQLRMPTVIDEFMRECSAIEGKRRLKSRDILAVLARLMLARGVQGHLSVQNGARFIARALRQWLGQIGVKTSEIEPVSPCESGRDELLNGKLRDECIKNELIYSLINASAVIEVWPQHCNPIQPHSLLDYQPPRPQTLLPTD